MLAMKTIVHSSHPRILAGGLVAVLAASIYA